MTMRIIMRRGGEESFLVPIDNFEKCQSLCTYWNKVSSLESNHIMKVTISINLPLFKLNSKVYLCS